MTNKDTPLFNGGVFYSGAKAVNINGALCMAAQKFFDNNHINKENVFTNENVFKIANLGSEGIAGIINAMPTSEVSKDNAIPSMEAVNHPIMSLHNNENS